MYASMCGCMCYSVRNVLVFVKKSANEFTMRKSAKILSVVVPQLSAVPLRVRSPSCSLHSSCKFKRLLVFKYISKFYEGGPFFR